MIFFNISMNHFNNHSTCGTNGTFDCEEDSSVCPSTSPVSCNQTQFQCNDTKCIDIEQLCDGFLDCSQEEDESMDRCSECFYSMHCCFIKFRTDSVFPFSLLHSYRLIFSVLYKLNNYLFTMTLQLHTSYTCP